MSLGHNNQEAQRSPRVQGPQADQAVLDSQVVRRDPGCLACPAPGHLGGGGVEETDQDNMDDLRGKERHGSERLELPGRPGGPLGPWTPTP